MLAQRLTGRPGLLPRVVDGPHPDVAVLEVPRHLDGISRRWPALAGVVKGAAVRRWLASTGAARPLVAFGMPQRWSLVGTGGTRVLDLHDPPLPEHDRDRWWAGTVSCARASRLVVTSARRLADGLADAGVTAELVPNASLAFPAPAHEADRGRVVGFVGALDWRIDTDLLAAVADRVPGVQLRIVGRVTPELGPVAADLGRRANVELVGQLTGPDLAAEVERHAVGLNPVRPGWLADCLNPAKAYEYAVHGVPMVSTDVAEARWLPGVVVAADTDGAVAAVVGLLEDPPDRPALRAFGNANTWSHRGDQLEAALVSAGLG